MSTHPGPAAIPVGAHRVAQRVAPENLVVEVAGLLDAGFRLGLVAAHDDGPTLRVVYLFLAGAPDRRIELVVTVPVDDPRLPTSAALSFSASRFEREMHDLFGIEPIGHPFLRPLVLHQH